MKNIHQKIAGSLLLLLITLLQMARAEYGSFYAGDNSRYTSPNGIYTVTIKPEPLPQYKEDKYDNFFTLQLVKNNTVEAQFPTIGYITSVNWSPDGESPTHFVVN